MVRRPRGPAPHHQVAEPIAVHVPASGDILASIIAAWLDAVDAPIGRGLVFRAP